MVSRESAHLLEDALGSMVAAAGRAGKSSDTIAVAVDFDGVEGMAPSFLDELLLIFESVLGLDTSGVERSLIVSNPPTRLSLKFEAIARGHEMSVRTLDDGSWALTHKRNDSA